MKTPLLLSALALLPSSARAARFAVYGDTRESDAEHARVVARLAAAAPDLALFVGDAVREGDDAAGWDAFFAIEKPLTDKAQVYFVPGNHDVGPLFMQRVHQPPVGALGTAEAFSFDAVGVHFLGLNTETNIALGTGAYQFVKKDLEAHAGQPVVVFMHRPLYSSGGHGGDVTLRAAYEPLFVKAGVLAVFQGHDHDYERTRPIDGVTYFVEGGGGATLGTFDGEAPPWSAFRLATHGYVVAEIDGGALAVSAFDSNGTLIDHVNLSRSAAAPAPQPAGPPHEERAGSGDLAIVGIAALVGLLGTAGAVASRKRAP